MLSYMHPVTTATSASSRACQRVRTIVGEAPPELSHPITSRSLPYRSSAVKWVEKESETPSSAYSGTLALRLRPWDQSRSSRKQSTPDVLTSAANPSSSTRLSPPPGSSATVHATVPPESRKSTPG